MKESDKRFEWFDKVESILKDNDEKMITVYEKSGIKKQNYLRKEKEKGGGK